MQQKPLHKAIWLLILMVVMGGLLLAWLSINQGTVIRVSAQLSKQHQPFSKDWPVYIYAAVPGTKLPLSSYKTTVSQLPLSVDLTEDMYLLPTHTMAEQEKLIVVLKLSSSGDPHQPGPEDLQVKSRVLDLSQRRQHRVELVLGN